MSASMRIDDHNVLLGRGIESLKVGIYFILELEDDIKKFSFVLVVKHRPDAEPLAELMLHPFQKPGRHETFASFMNGDTTLTITQESRDKFQATIRIGDEFETKYLLPKHIVSDICELKS